MAGWLSGCLGGCLDFCHGLQLSGCDDQIWQGCGLSRAEVERYGRQVVLPSLGPEGQKKLLRGSVLIVGAGGLGCPVALYLAAAGVGRIGLVDADTVALSNLHRQIGHLARSVGVNKATSLAKACRELNATVQLEVCPQRLSRLEETAELIARYDLVVDCTDAPPSRYLLNDGALCAQRPLVAASAVGLSGQLAVYNFEGGPCLRCVFPVSLADAEPVASCEEHGVLGPIVGTVGSLAALEVIKVLAKGSALHKSCLRGKLLLFDPTSSLQPCRTVKIHRQADCAGCAPKDGAAPPMPPAGCAMPLPREEISISPIELHSRLLAHRPTFLLDVRQRSHFAVTRLASAVNWPLTEMSRATEEEKLKKLSAAGDSLVVCVCRRGNDSLTATLLLREAGIVALNLQGGLQQLMAVSPDSRASRASLPALT
ncbi:unnamed protein product [Cladocopium goreaui]|uniref:Adenylyltransferase and sulfurtransferase MOCS3 (Molybdenum cofactor synthesis protein 3) n=1 Tax=Cladocopium goreaui TaxID=2562237 RepID=A0A9P1C3H8_9DINO|nr:unnamed protein product [Cladocopium goreaui]